MGTKEKMSSSPEVEIEIVNRYPRYTYEKDRKENYYYPTKSECLNECPKFIDEITSIDIEMYCKGSYLSCYKGEIVNSPLKDECYTPTGDDCSWYRNCVAKRYDCSKSHNYALNYGEKFCELYNDNFNSFSNDGKIWVDKVRKCLQLKLAQYIKPWSDVTCEELEKIAFESHNPCYLEPDGLKSSGICALRRDDWIQVFFTIKSAF